MVNVSHHEDYFRNEILKLISHRFKVKEVNDGYFSIARRGKTIFYNLHTAKINYFRGNSVFMNCGVDEFMLMAEKLL